jgi:hypothetical protein
MGKGQKLRREQEAAVAVGPSTIPSGKVANSFAPALAMPAAKPGLSVIAPPKPPAVANNGVISPAKVVKTQSIPFYTSIFQQTDGIEQFLALEETERLTKVEELLEQARVALTPSPQPILESKSTTIKSSQSMQSLSSSMKVLSLNQQEQMKHARSSNSLQDLNKQAEKTDTSLVESIVFDLTAILKGCGVTSLEGHRILTAMRDQVLSEDKTEKGLILMKSLLTMLDRVVEPYVFDLIGRILHLHADRSPMVRTVAAEVLDLLSALLCPYGIFALYDILEPCMKDDIDWRIKVAALQMLKSVSPRVTGLISSLLPRMIPQVCSQLRN